MVIVLVDAKAYGPHEPTVDPDALVSVQETISSQLAPLIVTTIVPPLEPVPPPVPAVGEPDSWPAAPAQMITSLPAFTTGFEHGGVGQLTE